MDIKLEKKPWYIRYRYYLIGGLLFAAFLIYVIVLSLGPRKLRIDAENIHLAKYVSYTDRVPLFRQCFRRKKPAAPELP